MDENREPTNQVIFNKDTKTIKWENNIFLTVLEKKKLDTHMQRNKIAPLPDTIYKNNRKWSKGTWVKAKL